MAKCLSQIFYLILHVSSRNELSESYNIWTDGAWSWDDMWVQEDSTKNHAEIGILDTQWYNENGQLSINYTYSIEFNNRDDGRSSGLIIYNGKAASYCEYYYFGMESWSGDYFVFISRAKAGNVNETTLISEQFSYVEYNTYTLSISIENSNTFNVWIDGIHHIFYTDDDGYTTVDREHSGYISIWSYRGIKTRAKYLEVSGTPVNVSPLSIDKCITLSPTQDPTQTPAESPLTEAPTVPSVTAQITAAPTKNKDVVGTLPHDTESPSSSYPTGSIEQMLSSIDTTVSIHNATRANTPVIGHPSGTKWILIGAGLLLLGAVICFICINCGRKDTRNGVHKAVNIGAVTSRSGTPNANAIDAEEHMLQMTGSKGHVVCVDEDTDEERLVAPAAGLAISRSSSDEEHMLPSGNVTIGGLAFNMSENEAVSASAAGPPPMAPAESDSEHVPPAPLPPNQYEQENNVMISGAFATSRAGE